jgi:hypothetical protein
MRNEAMERLSVLVGSWRTTMRNAWFDARDAYTALYHDERGVCRVFAMTFDDSQWILTREDPDMFQRFIADVGAHRVAGRWEGSDDQGSTWRKDFDLIFERRY